MEYDSPFFRNKLERISKSSLEGLFKLEKLKLSDNRIQALEEGSLDHLLSLTRLEVGDNPLVCNCSLAWLFQWLESRPVLTDEAKCALPIELADVTLGQALFLDTCLETHTSAMS